MSLSHTSSLPGPNPAAGGKSHDTSHKQKLWRILYIIYSLEVGGALLLLPWMAIWENNYLLYLHPQFRPIVANPFLKGAVLGLGIVNILIGFYEIACFQKDRIHR